MSWIIRHMNAAAIPVLYLTFYFSLIISREESIKSLFFHVSFICLSRDDVSKNERLT